MSDTTIETAAPSPAPAPREGARLGFWRATWIIASLELKQRTRSITWWVLLGVWFGVIGLVTLVSWGAIVASSQAYGSTQNGGAIFAIIVYFVLLFASLIAPAISGNAINSERNSATLATTQVTLVGHWSILIGKFLAAWLTGIAFLIAAVPFIAATLLMGGVEVLTFIGSIFALAIEIALLTAIGVGLSAVIRSPVFSIVVTYLVVAFLSVGTLIAFGLASSVSLEFHTVSYGYPSEEDWADYDACDGDQACIAALTPDCIAQDGPYPQTFSRYDRYWWLLAANPYVFVADFSATSFDSGGNPTDLFGWVKVAARSAQNPPEIPADGSTICQGFDGGLQDTPQQIIDSTFPTWWMGFILQAAGAAWALIGGAARIKTPAKRLPRGSRIA